jgi:hypothetical protein
MTTPDIADLCEKLRSSPTSMLIASSMVPVLRNPDGPEAAKTLERQAAEIERLRSPLPDLLQEHVFSLRVEAMAMGEAGAHYALIADLIEARAALTGEDHD